MLPAAAAGLAALVIGFFSIRVSGVYFIMLTLAFSQMFYAYTFQVAWLGAEDGLVGIPRPTIAGASVASTKSFHVYLLALVVLAALALWRIVRSPFGHVLRGIRENEARMEAVGYAVGRDKLLAFTVAGVLAGTAGSLYAQFNGSITPDAFFWTTSGEALLMVIIGGVGTLGGAMLGAAAFILLQSLVSTYTERWMLILGLTFVGFVLFAPGGIVGALRPGWVARVSESPLLPLEALARSFGALSALAGVSLRWRGPSAAPSSGRTARARPRCSTSSPGSSPRAAAASSSTARR